MKITVAIPCYNLEDRIAACLKSIIAQDYRNLEILVIDDHSTDHSVDIIKKTITEHNERDIRLIINEINWGLNKVRNLAIQEASGEALFFVDGDDTIEPGTLTLFHRKMEETHVEIVCGSFRKKDFNGNTYIVKQFPEDTFIGNFAYASYIEKHINGYFNLGVWNSLYHLNFLKSNKICCDTHYRIFDDRLFTFRVVLNAKSVSYIHNITYNYNDTPNSICHQNNDGGFIQAYRAIIESVINEKKIFEFKHKDKPFPKGLLFLVNYLCLTDGLLKKSIESDASREEKISLLRWIKEEFRKNNMKWNNQVGPYNRLSYIILMSPFPYTLFRFYFNHLQIVKKVIVSLKLSSRDI